MARFKKRTKKGEHVLVVNDDELGYLRVLLRSTAPEGDYLDPLWETVSAYASTSVTTLGPYDLRFRLLGSTVSSS